MMLTFCREDVSAAPRADEHVVAGFNIAVNFMRLRFIASRFARRPVVFRMTARAMWCALNHIKTLCIIRAAQQSVFVKADGV